MLGVWALCVPLGQRVGMGVVAFALLLWGLVPHARPGGDPLPPSMMPVVPDPDTERIRLASKVCLWAGLFGDVPALLWARFPMERELRRRACLTPRMATPTVLVALPGLCAGDDRHDDLGIRPPRGVPGCHVPVNDRTPRRNRGEA